MKVNLSKVIYSLKFSGEEKVPLKASLYGRIWMQNVALDSGTQLLDKL